MFICRNSYASRLALTALLFAGGIGVGLRAEDRTPPAAQFKHTRVILGKGQVPAPAAVAPRPASGHLTIIPTFDSSIQNDPRAADIMATINSAIAIYESTFTNSVTVNITYKKVNSGLGESLTNYFNFDYPDYYAALVANARTANDTNALANLPGGNTNPVDGNSQVTLSSPLARALGFSADPGPGQPDSTISLATGIMNLTDADNDPNKYALSSVVEHEMDEVLGLGSQLDDSASGPVYPEDLFRYDSQGNRSFTRDQSAESFFSLDGTTDLAQFNQDDSGDHGDWYSVNGGQIPQVQDAFGTPGSRPVLNVELVALDVIGWIRVSTHTINHPPVISSPVSFGPNPVFVGVQTTFMAAATDADNDVLVYSTGFRRRLDGHGRDHDTYVSRGKRLYRHGDRDRRIRRLGNEQRVGVCNRGVPQTDQHQEKFHAQLQNLQGRH